ncbi:MAG: FAD-binding oxidoreductase [Gammaproteobacteria bacterium]|nr:FAD-binding oxidoreductase [Gammaproteobacteria bacterium]
MITHHSPVQFQTKLPEEVDVLIIGGGIIGISTAWFLRQSGLKVLVCDKGRVAGEQSSRNWGWIRQQGRDEAELPIMMESVSIWRELTEQGINTGFHQGGSLYLCENQAQLERYNDFLGFAAKHKLDTQQLNSEQLYALLNNTPKHWRSALYTPNDGRAEPATAVPDLARACVQEAVLISENCAVDYLSITNQTIDGVQTERGYVKCSRVLVCAGHWSARLLHEVGIKLPQLSVKASVARTARAPLLFNGNASGSNLAFRRRLDGGYTVAMSDYLEVFPSVHSLKQASAFLPLLRSAAEKLKLRVYEESACVNPFDNDADYKKIAANRVLNPQPTTAALKRMRNRLDQVLPAMRGIPIVESWAGMIDATPDAVPVMDAVDSLDGLFIATGFSGHGFGIGPAAGKIMSGQIQGHTSEHDLSRFRFSRFNDGSELRLGPSI